ncbi:MAG: hypothetical protein MnENMB40S_28940 [Rhizobiaceae bacterium MnEN-MB40S]|nr:MAG: hypothetical protein MnENMB40S_28940 [Rhizobiaceae bacterium MnEN-MB40S]
MIAVVFAVVTLCAMFLLVWSDMPTKAEDKRNRRPVLYAGLTLMALAVVISVYFGVE